MTAETSRGGASAMVWATAALRAGVSPEVVSKRLGHSSIVVTLSIYAHVFEHDDQAAAECVAAAIYGA